MMTVHGTTHFFRDITETEIRIMSLQQSAKYSQALLQIRPLDMVINYFFSCDCVFLPEELRGCDKQKSLKR